MRKSYHHKLESIHSNSVAHIGNQSRKGVVCTDETKQLMSIAKSGKNHPFV